MNLNKSLPADISSHIITGSATVLVNGDMSKDNDYSLPIHANSAKPNKFNKFMSGFGIGSITQIKSGTNDFNSISGNASSSINAASTNILNSQSVPFNNYATTINTTQLNHSNNNLNTTSSSVVISAAKLITSLTNGNTNTNLSSSSSNTTKTANYNINSTNTPTSNNSNIFKITKSISSFNIKHSANNANSNPTIQINTNNTTQHKSKNKLNSSSANKNNSNNHKDKRKYFVYDN